MRHLIIYVITLLCLPVQARHTSPLFGEGQGGEAIRVSCCDWMMLKRQKLGEFQLCKDIGADGVEMDMGPLGRRVLFENKIRLEPQTAQKMKQTADSLNIKVSAIAMSGFFAQSLINGKVVVDDDTIARDDANYKALFNDCFDTMEKFDTKVAFLPLGGSGQEWQTGKGEVYDTLCARLKMAGDMAVGRGVVIGIRTAMPAKFGIKMLKDINSKGIKIYYNVQDACDNGWDVCKELKQLGKERLCGIHCSNTDSVTLRHDPEVDLPKIIKTLRKIGYNGWLTVERSRNAKDVKNVKGNFGDNVAYIKECLSD